MLFVDMLFDEDTILLSFFQRYTDPDEEDDLKRDVIKYCGGGNFGGKVAMEDQNTTGDSIDDVSCFPSNLLDFESIRLCRRHEKEATSCSSGSQETSKSS